MQINIGFFVMATVIMYRHQRRQTHQSGVQKVKHWIKASVSLVVVMGITWVMGVLVFTESLLPLAYIFTTFVAFQVSPRSPPSLPLASPCPPLIVGTHHFYTVCSPVETGKSRI